MDLDETPELQELLDGCLDLDLDGEPVMECSPHRAAAAGAGEGAIVEGGDPVVLASMLEALTEEEVRQCAVGDERQAALVHGKAGGGASGGGGCAGLERRKRFRALEEAIHPPIPAAMNPTQGGSEIIWHDRYAAPPASRAPLAPPPLPLAPPRSATSCASAAAANGITQEDFMLATASAAAARARGHISTGQQSAATKLGAACSPPRSLSPPRGGWRGARAPSPPAYPGFGPDDCAAAQTAAADDDEDDDARAEAECTAMPACARAAVAAVVGAVGDVKDRRRAKNREAAARCRVKRLAGVAAMKAENEELRARNAALEREVAALRAENAKLLGAHAGAAAADAALDRQRGEFDTALHQLSADELLSCTVGDTRQQELLPVADVRQQELLALGR